jgi:spermidine synthase
VIPWEQLDSAQVPGYGELTLHRRGAYFVIRLDGDELMGSHDHGSEDLLATLGCEGLATRANARVLIGGLGLGYTLRAVLDLLGPTARVDVAELVDATVRWNRGPLAHLAGHPLDDPRAHVVMGDVVDTIAAADSDYDAIMLDVDNGPDHTAGWGNARLYGPEGLRRIRRALRGEGCVAIWSASDTAGFTDALRAEFPASQCVRARSRGTANRHVVWLGRLAAQPPSRGQARDKPRNKPATRPGK